MTDKGLPRVRHRFERWLDFREPSATGRSRVSCRMVRRCFVAIALLTAALIGCGLEDPRPIPLARNCAEWSRLDVAERLQTAQAFIEPGLITTVGERQHLPPDATDAELLAAAGSSFDKVCELERRPGLMLSEIVTSLYR